MAIITASTKAGDSELKVVANADLNGFALQGFAKAGETYYDLTTTLDNVAKGSSTLSVNTSALPIGKYQLEVRAVLAGKTYTFPDSGYLNLTVYANLNN